jgi:hypothetical protein
MYVCVHHVREWQDVRQTAGRVLIALAIVILIGAGRPASAAAQTPPAASSESGLAVRPASPQEEEDDDAAVLDPAEPDIVVVNLPTTMRVPLYKGSFRINHRFAGNLRTGTFSELASNLFGIDQGAIIGFEYRMGLLPNLQAAAYRSSFDRTIQLHARYDLFRQRGSLPVAVSGLVSIEGTDNFQDDFAPAVGAVISRTLARRLALYVTPVWVNNTAASLAPIDHDHGDGTDVPGADVPQERRSTFYTGLAGRLRVLSTVYVVGEVTPRLNGYGPDDVAYGFGLEKRVGGHMFSLTFTNSFGTTFAQIARGGTANSLYLGFNLSRKFF